MFQEPAPRELLRTPSRRSSQNAPVRCGLPPRGRKYFRGILCRDAARGKRPGPNVGVGGNEAEARPERRHGTDPRGARVLPVLGGHSNVRGGDGASAQRHIFYEPPGTSPLACVGSYVKSAVTLVPHIRKSLCIGPGWCGLPRTSIPRRWVNSVDCPDAG